MNNRRILAWGAVLFFLALLPGLGERNSAILAEGDEFWVNLPAIFIADNTVETFAVVGTDLYVGGNFSNTPANYIAKWDGANWSTLGSGLNGYVRTITVSGINLYVGGEFNTAGGNPASNIAMWDGTVWSALGSGVGGFSGAKVRTTTASGADLYVGGNFFQAGVSTVGNLAKWQMYLNNPPVAQSQSIATTANTPISIELAATDADQDSLTYSVLAPPQHGTLTGDPPHFIYTPELNYYGPDEFTFQANDGKDDSNIATVSITVKRVFSFFGFEQPIDNEPVVNYAKGNSSIPVKWRILDVDGTPISDPVSFASLTSYTVPCDSFAGEPVDVLEEKATGQSGLQYLGDGYWQFNWKTSRSYSGSCRIMVLQLADGSEHIAFFSFK
jgi:hypothetical protein